ncbi:MAG: site-2 protease family protein [Alphaproteobacteria bacterium]|nr:MAG: site-2 protease family protein [Alphaproteobacteria bacterium]
MFSGVGETFATVAVWALPVLFAVTFHEAAHGFVAYRLGDDTAARAGRLTLNPFAHVDPFGTVLLPLLLILIGGIAFGYARPVPVNGARLRHPRRDMIWVALAGPAANLLLAVLAAMLLPLASSTGEAFGGWALRTLHVMVFFNCVIAIFNMLPVPPLDGGRVLLGLLPPPLARRYARLESVGLFLLIGILFLLPMLTSRLGIGFNPAVTLVFEPSQRLYDGIMGLLGIA